MHANKLLIVLLVLQSLTLAGQWLGAPALVAGAQAQIPDAGNQRIQILEQLQSLNGKMDKLIDILQSGQLQVRVANGEQDRKAEGSRP